MGYACTGERVGCLSFVVANKAAAVKVKSQLQLVIRPMYSSPPGHGAHIVERILSNPQLFEAWKVLICQ
jgi:aspartate/tyrosine/aromatic aminotransferase